MGGTSSSTTSQTSQTTPYSAASPALSGILSGLTNLVPQAGGNSTITNAENTLLGNFGAGNPYASLIGSTATGLLNGGGANNNNGAISSNLANYTGQLSPLASNTNYNPYSTPGFSDALATSDADITNNINSQWAAAGRDGSPGNAQALARGIAQGNSAAIAGQYNANVANQEGAANSLYGAGNTTYGLLNANQAQANANAQNGVTTAGSALDANNWGSLGTLSTEQNMFNLPASEYSTLLGAVSPVAQAFGTNTGSGTTTNTMSPIQEITSLAGLLGSAPGTAANGAKTGGTGMLGLGSWLLA